MPTNQDRLTAWHIKGGPHKHLNETRLGEGYCFPIDWNRPLDPQPELATFYQAPDTVRSIAWRLVAWLTRPWPRLNHRAHMYRLLNQKAPF